MAKCRIVILALCSSLSFLVSGQEKLSLSGSLDNNTYFYLLDERIVPPGIPQYERQQIGLETWLTIRAQIDGFDFGVRYDIFENSALLNPTDSYTAQGIGRWYAGKKLGKLSLLGGYIYDQIGSGIIFRAYEERPLLIDNALEGIKVAYEISTDWTIKGFAGKQKNLFDLYESVLTGGSIDGYMSFGEENPVTIAPGFGVIHKTLSDDQMDALAGTLSQYTPEDFIDSVPYNTVSMSVYNTLSAGRFSWYVEGAYKTEEVINDIYATSTLWTGVESVGKFVLTDGYVFYTTLSYAGDGIGISGQYKRTSNFVSRADPFVSGNRGLIDFLPPMARVNTYRLTSRYAPATQELDEEAFQIDARYSVNKNLSFLVNYAHIIRPKAEQNHDIYDELYTQFTLKKPKKWTMLGGVQFLKYDQELYQGKAGVPIIKAITPYIDYLYKFDQKKSLRTEVQYMSTQQDYGSWVYALTEFSISPHWLFELSDMYNIDPTLKEDGKERDKLHYPTAGVVYSAGSTRYSLRYVKQVEGVVCSGGICRLEPAFSGIKLNISANF